MLTFPTTENQNTDISDIDTRLLRSLSYYSSLGAPHTHITQKHIRRHIRQILFGKALILILLFNFNPLLSN